MHSKVLEKLPLQSVLIRTWVVIILTAMIGSFMLLISPVSCTVSIVLRFVLFDGVWLCLYALLVALGNVVNVLGD